MCAYRRLARRVFKRLTTWASTCALPFAGNQTGQGGRSTVGIPNQPFLETFDLEAMRKLGECSLGDAECGVLRTDYGFVGQQVLLDHDQARPGRSESMREVTSSVST